jgi:hypothetical protein
MNVYYEEAWETPLVDLRNIMNLPPFPTPGVARLDMAWSGEDPLPLIHHYKTAVTQIGVPSMSDFLRPSQLQGDGANHAAKAEDARKRAQLFEHAIEWLENYRVAKAKLTHDKRE